MLIFLITPATPRAPLTTSEIRGLMVDLFFLFICIGHYSSIIEDGEIDIEGGSDHHKEPFTTNPMQLKEEGLLYDAENLFTAKLLSLPCL
jgi:hypothetical protein